MKSPKLVEALVAEIKRIAEKLNVHPASLTKSQVISELEGFKEWDLRKVGGLTSLQTAYFPFEDKDLASVVDNKNKNSYVKKLEKEIGEVELRMRKFPQVLSEIVTRTSVIRPLILDKTATKRYLKEIASPPSDNSKRSICTIWSDQHFGTNFTKDHTKGLNAYNWDIAAHRLALLCEQIATFKIERRMVHEELVIFLLGDNIAGVIHDQEGGHIDLSAEQVWGTSGYYIQAISYLLNIFPKIRIECQTGNHGRVMHKKSKDRAMVAKFDSFETMIASNIMSYFAQDKRVTINIPKAPYSDVIVQGHRIYATHGDTVFNVGNPGKSIPLASIEKQINSINANLDMNEPRYELFLTGHVHHYMENHVGNVQVIVNGCMVGTDPFALSVGINDNNPTQVLWETTTHFAQGDLRQVHCKRADSASSETHKRFNKIITPYDTTYGKVHVWWTPRGRIIAK
jgi:hypothetical protein